MISTRHGPADYGFGMKELLRSSDPTVIAYASALLEGEGIPVFELDVHMSILIGSLGILPRRLMVRDHDLWRARIVLYDNDIPTGL
jgi:hypothetical protein